MSHPFLDSLPSPRVLAHRGFVSAAAAATGVAENSRQAIAAALDIGADIVEADCHLTSDGEIVLFHDATLTRILGDPRAVRAVAYAELATLMQPRGGLLTLEQAITEFPGLRLNLDVKVRAAAVAVGELVAELAHDRVLLTSFSDTTRELALAAAERRGPRPATSPGQRVMIAVLTALWSRSRARLDRALAGLDVLQVPERQGPVPVFGQALVRAAHLRGVEVHVWTVNDPQRMQRLVAAGADGIVTDRSDLALAAFRGA